MIKRTLLVTSDESRLFLKDSQLVVEKDGDRVGAAPVEDIGLLLVEARAATISARLMAALAEAGAAVMFCDGKHLPCSLSLPLAGNTLSTARLRNQVMVKKPLQKRLWQSLVRAKLLNQAALLPAASPPAGRLRALAEKVRSGDPENREGTGARLYWSVVFGDADFRRDRDGAPPNNLLNYGYAIIRAVIARAICSAGLHPALGVHHHLRDNAFCLADDLMEPFRPYVDREVRDLYQKGETELKPKIKKSLLELLETPVVVNGESSPLMVAGQYAADSLRRCYEGAGAALDLPLL